MASQGITQVPARAERARLEADRLAKRHHRFLVAALSQEDHAETVVEDGIGGRHRDRLAVGYRRLVDLAQTRERDRQVVPGLRVGRRQADRLPDGLFLLDVLALPAAVRGQAKPGQRVVTLVADRLAERGLGWAPLALALERDAELEMRLDAPGLEGEGRAQLRLRLGIAALAQREIAAVQTSAEFVHWRHVMRCAHAFQCSRPPSAGGLAEPSWSARLPRIPA